MLPIPSIVKSKLETSAEKSYCRWAKRQGFITRKMNGAGFRDWPDRYVLTTEVGLWIEFKREKKTPRIGQHKIIRLLRQANEHVLVTDSAKEAIEWTTEILLTMVPK